MVSNLTAGNLTAGGSFGILVAGLFSPPTEEMVDYIRVTTLTSTGFKID